MRRLSILLALLAPLALGCSADKLSSAGQAISCTTDPGTGVILACAPGGGSGSGSGSTCMDIDEDGDGSPHDSTESRSDDDQHKWQPAGVGDTTQQTSH